MEQEYMIKCHGHEQEIAVQLCHIEESGLKLNNVRQF